MSASKAYQVIIMKSRKLNIIMANNSGAQLRTYSHFVTLEDARRFADILEESLAEGKYWDVDRCQLCGEAFTRQNHLCLLKDGRVIHMFERANEKRSSKVAPPQRTDAQKVLHRLSRGYSTNMEQAVLHLLNLLIAEPEQIIALQSSPTNLNRAAELHSALEHELEQQSINEDAAKRLAMELASVQYEEIGSQEYETKRLRRLFQRHVPMQSLDAELLQAAVSRIHIQGKKIKIQLKSGQILERRLQT